PAVRRGRLPDLAIHTEPRHRRRRPARNAQLVLPDRRNGRARHATEVVGTGHHRRLQLQQVFCDLRRKATSMPKTIGAGGILTSYLDAGSGPPVVLLHGSGPGVSAQANWQRNIGPLSKRFRVLAPDLVGFGATERPDDIVYSLRTWVDHVWSFLDALGIGRASIIGNSLGGRIALSMAAERPDRVAKMVLMGSPGVGMTMTPGLMALRAYTP